MSELPAPELNITLRRNLEHGGISDLTEFQKEAFAAISGGRDVVATAPTGTGKTAAYLLPLISLLLREPEEVSPLLLILVPTRELCRQIARVVQQFTKDLSLPALALYGGQKDAAREDEEEETPYWRILIATPGRLVDLAGRKDSPLPQVGRIVLDEADRLLDTEFLDETLHILDRTPLPRQMIMVSATFPDDLRPVMQDLLHRPLTIRAAPAQTSTADGKIRPSVRQGVIFTEARQKPDILRTLLLQRPDQSCIVFANTREEAAATFRQLRSAKLSVVTLHGGMDQEARNKATDRFRSGRATILITTDLVARGLDIGQVRQIISLSPPETPETYIHRIGRTGRAGKTGWAVTLCTPSERSALRKVEITQKQHLTVLPSP
ncbi:DEAD/DEAH box helicase [Acetobacter sp. AN02]|uniref:DEAD/DEAH box helicase n=1 Tax=Acetobacter sp. AN02 TaxID=2894186 RepID=UPI00243429A2|nr:DEAD/DEAH box helicase [Acetobacter sp. AN02]MDG6095465.1 DEAD/DEAH box helicase [Acetobacter sp. AN02]